MELRITSNQEVIDRLIGEAQYMAISTIRDLATRILSEYPEAITFVLNDGSYAMETNSPTQTTSPQLYRDIEQLERFIDRNSRIISGCIIVIPKDEVLGGES